MATSHEPPATRRDFLRAGVAAAGAAAVAPLATAATSSPPRPPFGTAKSCIFINLIGGPSQLDTWDPKPDAPADVRGPFACIPTRTPGVRFSELFPKMAAASDKFTLLRGMHHTAAPIHEAGLQLLNTGRLFRDGPEWPSVGAIVAHLRREAGVTPHSYFTIPTTEPSTGLNVSRGMGPGHLDVRAAVWEGGGPDATPGSRFARFGNSYFGKNLAWAAMTSRLGLPFVVVNMFPTVFDAPSWDCHADHGSLSCSLHDYRDTVAPMFDAAFTTLITDLDSRDLLDTTLVVASGEFGRTPRLNRNGGRDHWPSAWTALVAGGGVQGGRVIGATDAHAAEVTDRPVTPQELVSTVFHALGVPADATIPGPDGSPVAVYPGRPVMELF